MVKPSMQDEINYHLARAHMATFLESNKREFSGNRNVLEIGPHLREPWFDTLDIVGPATYVADITKRIPVDDHTYDTVLCMDVLEHTLNPFAALEEIRRVLKPGGVLLASAPMDFREHGPLPDCWRFTRHGWRVLLKDWVYMPFDVFMSPDRPLMPLHICVFAVANHDVKVDPSTLEFARQDT